MGNIFKDIISLYKECGKTKLTLEQTLIYYNRRKKFWAAYMYAGLLFGLHRIYLGDKFSKTYALFLMGCDIITRTLLSSTIKYYPQHDIQLCIINIAYIFIIPQFADIILIIPSIIKHNLQLKKNIINNKINKLSKSTNPFYVQDILSLIGVIFIVQRIPLTAIPLTILAIIDFARIDKAKHKLVKFTRYADYQTPSNEQSHPTHQR